VIASIAVSPAVKTKLTEAKLLDCIIVAMNRFQDNVQLQEQSCRGITTISKGVESIKEYLAVRQDELGVVEAINFALTEFHAEEHLVEAGCSAVWSVAFKNVRMKNRAGEAGVFGTVMDLIREHVGNVDILPHAFVAIGNLSANHAPNQAICGQAGVVELCLEMIPLHARPEMVGNNTHSTIVFTILSCLNAVMAEQSDNIGKFVDTGGVAIVQQATSVHKGPNIGKLVQYVMAGVKQQEQTATQRAKEKNRAKTSASAILEGHETGVSLYDSTFSRTVWRLYGGAEGLVMWYRPRTDGGAAGEREGHAAQAGQVPGQVQEGAEGSGQDRIPTAARAQIFPGEGARLQAA
jgi:hypothetical protein